jgi:threonine synthase
MFVGLCDNSNSKPKTKLKKWTTTVYTINAKINFKNAVVQGLAKDRGIYFPDTIHHFLKILFRTFEYSNHEIAMKLLNSLLMKSLTEN